MPHLGSGITFAWNGTTVLASPNLQGGAIDVVDMKSWKPVRTIATPGPGFFMRSHENTPFAWTDSMMSPTGKTPSPSSTSARWRVVAKVREPGRDTGAHRVHQGRALRPGQRVGDGRRRGGVRRADLQGSQAPAHEQARGQVQRVEQDHAQRGHLALASLASAAGRTQRGWNTAAAVLRTRSSAAFCTWVDGRCKLVASDNAMRSGGDTNNNLRGVSRGH